jgi:hypothetical protein
MTALTQKLPAYGQREFALPNSDKASDKSEKNTLNRYVEIIPTSAFRSHFIKEKLWKTAALATVIFFIAVAAAATVATGLLAPVYLPIAALAVLSLVDFVYKGFSYFSQNGAREAILAQEAKFIVENLKELTAKSDKEIYEVFQSIGIARHELSSEVPIDKLLRVALRCKFWQNTEKNIREERDNLRKEKIDSPDILKANRLLRYDLEQQMLTAKVWTAYFYGITKNPTQKAGLENICQLYKPSFEDRYLDSAYEGTSPFVVFHDQNKKPIDFFDLPRMTTPELSRQLMSAAPAV